MEASNQVLGRVPLQGGEGRAFLVKATVCAKSQEMFRKWGVGGPEELMADERRISQG